MECRLPPLVAEDGMQCYIRLTLRHLLQYHAHLTMELDGDQLIMDEYEHVPPRVCNTAGL